MHQAAVVVRVAIVAVFQLIGVGFKPCAEAPCLHTTRGVIMPHHDGPRANPLDGQSFDGQHATISALQYSIFVLHRCCRRHSVTIRQPSHGGFLGKGLAVRDPEDNRINAGAQGA